MKRSSLIAATAFSLIAGGCYAAEKSSPFTFDNFGSWGFDLSGSDTSVKPGDNFFEYANGTAVRDMVIPPDRTQYGAFVKLTDLSEQRVHDILDEASGKSGVNPSGPVEKAGAMYKSFMDETAVNGRAGKPLQADLDAIKAVRTPEDFAALQGRAQYGFQGSMFAMDIEPDAKDPTQYSINLGQSGLGLPDRDYYLTQQFADKKAKYPGFVTQMLKLANWNDPQGAAQRILGLEQKIAEVSWARAEERDPDKMYHPLTPDALAKAAPGFAWAAYFKAAGLGAPAKIIVGDDTAIPKITAIIGQTPVETLKDWAAFHLVLNAAPDLSDDFSNANFEFNAHELQGQPQQRPRWKRAVAAVDAALGEAVGQAYVAKYYPSEAQQKMQELTHDLKNAFQHRLENNSWMSPETKQKALEKLSAFDFQIGYPKKWRDYTALNIESADLYGNVERGIAFTWEFWLSHLGKPVDKDQWDMVPQTVNAYNNPVFNEVVFPAAILQPPFFNNSADPAINYGAIGGVIGHEMTHGFDDQGRKFDAKGRLHDWWTVEDAKRFDALGKKYGAEFAAMDIMPGGHINPELTMGENIADLGGLTLALEAYHAYLGGKPAPVVEGITGDQRVFLGWAQVWRAKLRPDAARQRLVIDPHSPPVARVNGPMQNIDGWYAAFDVKPGEKHYLDPKDRVQIW